MPTPSLYDITQIPYFAYSPDLLTWGAFIVLALILFFVLRFIKHEPAPNSDINVAALTVESLKEIAAKQAFTKFDLEKTSLFVRRFLSTVVNDDTPFAEMDSRELRDYIKLSKQKTLNQTIEKILELEEYLYRPNTEVTKLGHTYFMDLAEKIERLTLEAKI